MYEFLWKICLTLGTFLAGCAAFALAATAFDESRSARGWTEFMTGLMFSAIAALFVWAGSVAYWKLMSEPEVFNHLPKFMRKS